MSDATHLIDYWNGRRVLVTGAGGFIGRRLTRKLAALGADVVAIDIVDGVFDGSVREIRCDLSQKDGIATVLREENPEVIFHLAATSNRGMDTNAVQTAFRSVFLPAHYLLLASGELPHPPRIFAFGSGDEYGDNQTPFTEEQEARPLTPAAFAKAAVTRLCLDDTLRNPFITVVRPSVVYGPGQLPAMFIPQAITTLLSGRQFDMTPGEQTRDFVYVDDVVEAVLRLADAEASFGQIVNIGAGIPHALKDVARRIAELCGAEQHLRIGALPYRASEVGAYEFSNTKLRSILSWVPDTSLEKGLHETIASFAHHQLEK